VQGIPLIAMILGGAALFRVALLVHRYTVRGSWVMAFARLASKGFSRLSFAPGPLCRLQPYLLNDQSQAFLVRLSQPHWTGGRGPAWLCTVSVSTHCLSGPSLNAWPVAAR